MRIIHISDFHIDADNIEDLRNYVIKPLVEDLIRHNTDKKIDIVAFSGDLVDKGGKSFSNDLELGFYMFQEEVIEPIVNAIDIPLEHFFFVPGNHDIVRTADKEIHEKGLLSLLKSSDKVNDFIDSGDVDGIRRILPFKKFEKEYFLNYPDEFEITNFQSTFRMKLNDKHVGITCFNTSWRCYDSDNDYQNLILGERQITRARSLIDDCDIKIGILHHPLDELAKFEAKQIESMLIKDYDILFCGHVHEGSNWSKTTMQGATIISIAPSNWTPNIRKNNTLYANGYSILDYLDTKVEINHRRYSHIKQSFVANTDLGDDFGKVSYSFPSANELARKEDEYNIIEKIKDVHLNYIDQHLISYETDTNAPKRISDLFVMPRIVQKEEEKINNEVEVYSATEKVFEIEDICKSGQNLLLIGVKEAGKTILMDRILIELTENYSDYLKIPVYIDFENMISNKIETLISKYLNIGIHDIKKEVLVNQKIVLLIDNLKFETKYKAFLANLEDFMINNPNITVIANCTSSTEEEIPVEAFDYNIIEMFSPAFIQSFKTKEIRQLMEKWFSNNTRFSQDSSKDLEKLINSFSGLNIPRTPMAVSMFLWILEKQENYTPLNNSQMLENFLERLFTKTASNQVYSSEFNFKNKERLLTEIALFMYLENQSSYRISYQDLRNFIFEKLQIKKFDFDEEELLKEFINKGIFTVEKEGINKYIRFKFTCFFQFFLMKNIDINADFKEHVLSEENYLSFIDELDYYSGLKADDSELLKLVVNRMFNEYSLFLAKIEDTQYTYDNPFESLSTIVDRLSVADMEEITNQSKQTDEEVEEEHDRKLINSNGNKIVKKDKELNPIVKLERLWVLAAKVLKNTEEITIENLKSDAISKVIKCSMAFASIYKYIITSYQERKKDNKFSNKDEHFQLISRMLPLIHQIVVYQTMGTGKLKIVIQEKIENIIYDKTKSDFEKFLYVFIYSDLDGKNKFSYISTLIKNINRHYIKDMIFIKLLEYYFKKDISLKEEDEYKKLLGNLITIDDGESNERRDFHKKGRFISRLEKSKQEKELLELSN